MSGKGPRLLKSERGKLSKRQLGTVDRMTDGVQKAKQVVRDLKETRAAKRENVKASRGHLDILDDKLAQHSLTKKRDAKSQEVTMAESELEDVIGDLARATAVLEQKMHKRNLAISSLKDGLAVADSDDDDDDDNDDDDDGD